MSTVIRVAEHLGTASLQGRPLGRKHYPRLCEPLVDVPPGGVVLLDFNGVEIVTESWISLRPSSRSFTGPRTSG